VGLFVGDGVAVPREVALGVGDSSGVAVLAEIAVGVGDDVGDGDAVTAGKVGEEEGDGVDVGIGGGVVGTMAVTAIAVSRSDVLFVAKSATVSASCAVSSPNIKKLRTVRTVRATSARLARITFCLFVTLSLLFASSLTASVSFKPGRPYNRIRSDAELGRQTRQVYHIHYDHAKHWWWAPWEAHRTSTIGRAKLDE
jgi:hypothetical protein